MGDSKPTVVVTGIAGNLGTRLLPQLSEFNVIGIDVNPPVTDLPLQFERMDLGEEASCRQMFHLLRESRAEAVIHLAFVLDPVRSGVLDPDRMWHINVAGTARVMEAITEANQEESIIRKFIFPSSVSVYGPELDGPATEEHALGAHTLPYAIQKMECDKVVQQRSPALRGCSAYMLRPHIFTGASVQNYMVDVFRGTPNGKSERAGRLRSRGKRLPCVLPYGQRYLQHRMQFVHVDDVARLMTRILQKTEPEAQRLTILNVAGRGEPLTLEQCLDIAQAKVIRLPGQFAFKTVLTFLWKLGIVAIPPEAAPYMTGEYLMNTDRLRTFLGENYEDVIRYTIAEAFADSFKVEPVVKAVEEPAAEA